MMQKLPLRNGSRDQPLDKLIPVILRPLFRAYILGYASSAGPRLLTLLLLHVSRRRKNIDPRPEDEDYFWASFVGILKGGLELQRFPTFCAALVGGSTLLQAREVIMAGDEDADRGFRSLYERLLSDCLEIYPSSQS